MVDAKKYFEADADRLEKAGDSDVCLVTIDFEDQRADFIWFDPDAADPIDGKYEVDGYTIQYSDQPNYEWYALINGELVDVSGYEWKDFGEFIDAVIEEYQK